MDSSDTQFLHTIVNSVLKPPVPTVSAHGSRAPRGVPLKNTCCPAALKNLFPVIDKVEMASTKPAETAKSAVVNDRIEYIPENPRITINRFYQIPRARKKSDKKGKRRFLDSRVFGDSERIGEKYFGGIVWRD